MIKKDRLEKIAQSMKSNPIILPKDVAMHKDLTLDGNVAFVFRHKQLGELGKMIIVPQANGQTRWDSCITGDPDDPMTNKRRAIIEPLFKALCQRADELFGSSPAQPSTYRQQEEKHLVKSIVMPCEKCGAVTAMLIMSGADTEDELEDHARIMFAKVKELNVPTWVLGYEKEVTDINGKKCGEALVLKIWPEREAAKIMLSTELDPILDELMDTHCL